MGNALRVEPYSSCQFPYLPHLVNVTLWDRKSGPRDPTVGRSSRSPAAPSLPPLCSKGLTGYWEVSQNNMLHIVVGDNHSPRSRARPGLQTQQDVGKERGAPCRSLPPGSPCLHRRRKLQEAWAIVPQRRAPDLHSAKRAFPHATLTQDHSLLDAHSVETSLLFQ